ncbi:uncharacterized protein IAS62_002058 [Cryptococcus decagattii]|uniref:Uncharacterized protein n=1 Tax=Cryptococcus decagattii TaxID=1859122 RepID=A0ABZ2AQH1_9TREE
MSTSNNDLRCNNLKCRGFLSMEEQAVVTTCSRASPYDSYLTDLYLARQLSLLHPLPVQRAIKPFRSLTILWFPLTEFQSILAGLPPSTILEVTARAIGFWTYQLSQESACQALVLKTAQNRQACTEKQLNNVANNKIVSLENELDASRRKIQGLLIESHGKDRELSCLRDDLENMKRKNPLNGIAQAGEKIVESSHPKRTFSAPMNGSTPIHRSTERFTVTPHLRHNQMPFRSQSSGPYSPIAPSLFSQSGVGTSNNGVSASGSAERRLRATRMATTIGRARF